MAKVTKLSFGETFLASVASLKFLKTIAHQSWRVSLRYFLKLLLAYSVVVSIILTIQFAYFWQNSPQIAELEADFPQVTITDGVAVAEQEKPYWKSFQWGATSFDLGVDTEVKVHQVLEKYPQMDAFMLLAKNGLLFKSPASTEVEHLSWLSVSDFSLDKLWITENLGWLLFGLGVMYFIIVFLFAFFVNFSLVLITTGFYATGFLVSKKKLARKEVFNIAVYSLTAPLLFSFFLVLFKVPFSLWLHLFIFGVYFLGGVSWLTNHGWKTERS